MLLTISLLLAALLGFAAHRASLCSVKAVAEIITTRRAYMLAGFAKAALWVMVLALPLSWLFPGLLPGQAHLLDTTVLVGGFLFGVGAAINGGCAFYTLSRLASGEFTMLITLMGMAAGMHVAIAATGGLLPGPAIPLLAAYDSPSTPVLVLWLILLVLSAWEAWRLLRSAGALSVRERLLAHQYRISTAAALLGLSNALLFLLWGDWAYTSALRGQISDPSSAGWQLPVLGLSVFLGMLLSAWQRRDFRLQAGRPMQWLMNLGGGFLMGFGASLGAGGNDSLLLSAIPALSPHGVPAYLSLLFGVACVILLRRRLSGELPVVDCRLDLLRRGK